MSQSLVLTPQKFERRRLIWLATAALLGTIIFLAPLPPPMIVGSLSASLTPAGKAVLAVLAGCVVLWVAEAVPFVVTALAGLLVLALAGIYPGDLQSQVGRLVADGFGNRIVIFFIGVLTLSAAFAHTGLDRRVGLVILRACGQRPQRLVLGVLLAGAALAMWITALAAAAALIPVARGILALTPVGPTRTHFGRALFMAVAWGPLIGGMATPLGTGGNLAAIAAARELAGVEVTFLAWSLIGLPTALVLLFAGWRLLCWFFPVDLDALPAMPVLADGTDAVMPPLREAPEQVRVLAIAAVAVVLWVAWPGAMEWVALLAAVLLLVPGLGVLSWAEAERRINWGGIILIAVSLSLGRAAAETGLASYLAYGLLGHGVVSLPYFPSALVLASATALLHIPFASNTLTGALVAPLVLPLAADFGLHPWLTLAPAAVSNSLGFLLVTEGPSSVLAYAEGRFTPRDFFRAGLPMTLVALVAVAVVCSVLGPLSALLLR